MTFCSDEKQVQVVVSLLKAHGIKNVIASPGATNLTFVASLQSDPYFRMFSSVDERSAAYMACGLSAETGEPVVLTCTGATASRNYMPGLTEAFYRKLPVLAITSTQIRARVAQHVAQVIDRSNPPRDVARVSVELPVAKDTDDIWECEIKVNRAILELFRSGGGPAHINLPTTYSRNFTDCDLTRYRVIKRWTMEDDELPPLRGRVAVFIGARSRWSEADSDALDKFCQINDAVVFCDHTSGYRGKYRITSALVGGQNDVNLSNIKPDTTIHIGEISGDYESHSLIGKEVWRVNPDGEIRDTFRKLTHVFEMSEASFFYKYAQGEPRGGEFFEQWRTNLQNNRSKISDLPFSNIWLASQFADRVPQGAVIHFAILNSLRAWNFFDLPTGVNASSNTGGFGIDGCLSTLVGASLADPERIFILVTGDLAFFYDMNVLGNRHLGSNVRVLLVNNGRGTEFTQYGHPGSALGVQAEEFIAAVGHFGSKSPDLVKCYAEGLGIEYMRVRGKDDACSAMKRLLSSEMYDRPILVEAFVNAEDESIALEKIKNLLPSRRGVARRFAKELIGAEGVRVAKRIFER